MNPTQTLPQTPLPANMSTPTGATYAPPPATPQTPPEPAPPPTTPVALPAAVTQSQTAADGSKTTTKTEMAAQPLQMPQNGSVVDLLNSAGVDSSQANRELLAQKYGVQSYDFSADKNKELADKFLAAFNANKGSATPQTGADARSAISTYFGDQTPKEDAQANFFDTYASMNPVVKNLYDTINQQLSTPATQETFEQEYQSLMTSQGVPALRTSLMNIINIMDGTEDDIRNEITKAGGFATDSQVQALTAARNKTLLKQANSLQQQLSQKQDYVDQIMKFSQLDRTEVENQVDKKIGLEKDLVDKQDKMDSAAKDNYKTIITASGYSGLAKILGGNPTVQANAERVLGLPKGTLSSPTLLASLNTGANDKLQFISGTANQQAGTFDQTTGKFTPIAGVGGPSASTDTNNLTSIDPQSQSILAQTGLSIQAFNYLSQGTASLSRLSAAQRTQIMNQANAFLNKNGIDYSTFQSRYQAYNKVLQGNVERQNAAQIQENEILGTTANMEETISASDLGNLKATNLAKLFAGEQFNDPLVTKYATYLSSLRNELAGYNAAVRGNLSAIGGPSPDKQDLDEASRVIENGISSGSLAGFKDAIVSQQQKMGTVLQGSVDSANKAVWDLFGVGQNFNTAGGVSKGSMSDKEYVAKAVANSGQTYNAILNGAKTGEIAVVDNTSGKIGYIPVSEFTSNQYTRL